MAVQNQKQERSKELKKNIENLTQDWPPRQKGAFDRASSNWAKMAGNSHGAMSEECKQKIMESEKE